MIENLWLPMVAMACLAVQGTQFATAALRCRARGLRNSAQLRSRQAMLEHTSQVARLAAQLGRPEESSNNIPWRILEVADVVQESVDCRSFYLVDPYGQPLPDFRPGQFVMVRPALAGGLPSHALLLFVKLT